MNGNVFRAVRHNEGVKGTLKLHHSKPEGIVARRILQGLVEPEVKELCEMVVPRSNGKAVLPVLWPAVNDVFAPVNNRSLLASGFLVAAVAPVVGPNIECIEFLVDSFREIGAGGFAVIQLAVETVRGLKAPIAV